MAGPAEQLSTRLWRLELPSRTLAPSRTTNCYLVADSGVGLLVDPGFSDRSSLGAVESLLEAAGVRLLKGVLLTHGHADHAAGLPALLESRSDPAVYAHPAEWHRLGSELSPRALQEGRTLTVGNATARALHTPGHSPGHLSFELPSEGAVLAGDLVAGVGSTWVGLPEGDIGAYLASLDRLLELKPAILGPGHGPIPRDPATRLRWAKAHRLQREAQILAILKGGPQTLTGLRGAIYPGVSEELRSTVDSTLLAHLAKLMTEFRAIHLGADQEGPYSADP
ncbi:MAG: MBL fold metallo-hydrolase [Truepera sp.]|nr:MBL fold metallo-hydrolase [Truepera sp.]